MVSQSAIFVSQDAVSDGTIRNIFKTYFLILFLYVAAIGGICCRHLIKYRLLQGRAVPLTQTLGWIHGPAYFKTFFELRSLPGGLLGLLMIFSSCLDLIGSYGVGQTVTKYSRWLYEFHPAGGILSADTRTSSPSMNWEAYRYADAAQINSYYYANATGYGSPHYGIYRMFAYEPRFLASTEETIGYWSCSRTTNTSIVYDQTWKGNATEVYDMDIWQDLFNQGLVYGYWYIPHSGNVSFYDSNNYAIGPSTHTTIITASSYQVGDLFEIKAAVDTADLDSLGSKQMDTWHCVLRSTEPTKTVESIAKVINIDEVLSNWALDISGGMFPGLHENVSYPLDVVEVNLQRYLNDMIMVAGASESVTTPNTASLEMGVIKDFTIIPYWIIGICAIAFALAAGLTGYALFLFCAVRARKVVYDRLEGQGSHVSSKEICESTPVGMLEWMTHAAYESRDADQIPEKRQLGKWILSTT